MMRQYELVERVTRYNPDADEALLNKAYVYAMQKHGSQMRASGDPYFSHPLEVAAILTDLRLDDATIAVALLHDTIEDTDATRTEIDSLFGEEIGKLVDGLTKIKRLDLVSQKAKQAENFRKLLLAIADDVRVLLVKLADRLHNMRTLGHMPEHKRGRIAEETMEIYAPLAGRMGMHDMREELEDISFRTLNPEAYETITERLADLRERNRDLIASIEQTLTERLSDRGMAALVKGREKRPYSIFRKMQRKAIGFEQLSDIYGFRVTVGTMEACYRVLGVIHTTWPTVPGRFKDYISTPKQNDYKSIHTTIVGPSRQRVELQIRTITMDRIAEYGIAAHALYKDGEFGGRNIARHSEDCRAFEWLRRTTELLAQGDTPEEFLENTKLELFHDQVFCFTPKGRLIALPRGATPIDFAYAVHTGIGNTCVGCKVNGKIMPLVTELHNGDEVDIIRSQSQTPPPAWEAIAVTGKARAAIRRATRESVRKQYGALGEHILKRAFDRASKVYSEDLLEAVLNEHSVSSVADLLAAVGRGDITAQNVLKSAHPDYQDERVAVPGPPSEEGWFGLKQGYGLKFRIPPSGLSDESANVSSPDGDASGPALPIRGLSGDIPVSFAPDGGAVPGDRIVGILTPSEGLTIYPIQSPSLKEFDDQTERWVDVRWDIDINNPERFPARLDISAANEPGSLAAIAQIIGENSGNIDNVKMVQRAPDFHQMVIDLEVWDLKHLNRIINQLRTKPNVSSVSRVNG
ncbi:bifunctional (p)ppGpp synthetase/guanosine-3',5'-bis(diphosphate) 3'-pyrophosphohydrolase [Roseibium denhamense]|uniref:GTP pyrophosphokinase rsh n=1 Tax=Roseibium denhamense TaxID=76305 RepID=A0ABY1NVF1_9HYPH|nr:bifunctional (p)ppGpp synthetase/guanosine-3',5'-bis(diphosphate) 3'-pyrophosphohydrolase [Roseibium denhamense]MTI04796.1 bifunctional (p)ppGpp synthetase/guanosine-3',5'-bis(diphosphate) 3'-pyrophosphohydrolase [Roseibium denhamense]SMP19277.1 guanosine-3',5'-bis(diphosphate) 3'-pyrophosphohydrolase [Roseibium denhamense]